MTESKELFDFKMRIAQNMVHKIYFSSGVLMGIVIAMLTIILSLTYFISSSSELSRIMTIIMTAKPKLNAVVYLVFLMTFILSIVGMILLMLGIHYNIKDVKTQVSHSKIENNSKHPCAFQSLANFWS
ncbi:MAG: hypothetical protein Q8O34_13360 [Rhodocyclaceae bacterium]|nr:hypothetical protein [Rhodocyclaceae bacterium]